MGMINLALDTELTEEQRDYMDTALSANESLLGIINGILDFSKIEAGHLELNENIFNLHTVVQGTANDVHA